MEAVFGVRVDVITLARDSNRTAAGYFAARAVRDARFDVILEVMLNVARRVECERRAAIGVGPDLLAFDDLAPLPAAVPVSGRDVIVVPSEIALWIPPVIERVLMDQNFYGRVGHRAAEVIIGLDVYFDPV